MSASELSRQQSLYRSHRPRTFADVVGQEPVVRTLTNAVLRDRVHHAYLFVGSRGTGKTSMAKILAACLNCERGVTVEPCGVCASCRSIVSATSLDVIEMDAASNNSVDDIRELRDSVAFAPVSGGRKVYILDEAHMLSTAAWNAFLKTLEEPPPGTVFVLATTEAQKVPPTVVDRCHRFDFRRPTVDQIASVVARVAEEESIRIGPEAVAAIARSATGSFRDALGTLEQLVSYCGEEVLLADVLAVLGVADQELVAEVFDAVQDGDARRVLVAVGACVDGGRDMASFASDLEIRARELLVVQTLGEVPPELSLTAEADAALSAQAQRVGRAQVLATLDLLARAMEAIRAGADARTQVEIALIRAARPQLDPSLSAILDRVQRLEEILRSTAEPPLTPLTDPPAKLDPSPSSPVVEAPPPAKLDPSPSSPVVEAPPATSVDAVVRESPEESVADGDASQVGLPAGRAPEEEDGVIEAGTGGGNLVEGSLEAIVGVWGAVIGLVNEKNAMLAVVIADGRPVRVDGSDLTIAFGPAAALYKRMAEGPANRAILTEALLRLVGQRFALTYELREDGGSGRDDADGAPISEEEWVRRFMEEFDAQEDVIGEGETPVRVDEVDTRSGHTSDERRR